MFTFLALSRYKVKQFRCTVWLQEERVTSFPVLLVSLSLNRGRMWFHNPAGQGNWIPAYHFTAGKQVPSCWLCEDSRVKPRFSWNGSAISVVTSWINFAAHALLCSSCSSWSEMSSGLQETCCLLLLLPSLEQIILYLHVRFSRLSIDLVNVFTEYLKI